MSRMEPMAKRRDLYQPFAGSLDHIAVSEVMTQAVICVRPRMRASDLRTLLLEQDIGGAPVVDDDGTPVGVISQTDLVRDSASGDGQSRVEDLMMPVPLTVPQATSVSRALALMAYENVHRLLVLSPERRVVGILSAMDLLRVVARVEGFAVAPLRGGRAGVVEGGDHCSIIDEEARRRTGA